MPTSAATPLTPSALSNEGLTPVPQANRTWTVWNIAALWVGMAVCIPTYMLGSSMVKMGLDWKQAILAVLVGSGVILIPMVLNAMPGTKYGIPFPVLIRSSFGIYGANIAALIRAFIACGWFGIQTYFGGQAIYTIAAVLLGFTPATPDQFLPYLDSSAGQFVCFMLFWGLQVVIIVKGIESIKWLETLAAPVLLLLGVGLLFWAIHVAGGLAPLLSQAATTTGGTLQSPGAFWLVFATAVTGVIGAWATLSLNIPDFSRFAQSQRAQIIGQSIALPITMTFYAGIGILVTNATVLAYGEAIWDPVKLIGKLHDPLVVVFSLIMLSIATISTNLAANVVSPANDFSNLWPRKISFLTGALMTAALGVLMRPWVLVADGRIFDFLVAYSVLLGPIAGIMIADYFLIKKQRLDVGGLFSRDGPYTYTGGFNPIAILALILGVLPNIPGFLSKEHLIRSVQLFWSELYSFAWFVGFFIAFVVYVVGQRLSDRT